MYDQFPSVQYAQMSDFIAHGLQLLQATAGGGGGCSLGESARWGAGACPESDLLLPAFCAPIDSAQCLSLHELQPTKYFVELKSEFT